MKKKILIFATIIALIDQIIKKTIVSSIIYQKMYFIFPRLLYITYVKNSGGAWSILSGNIFFLLIVSSFCLIGIGYYLYHKSNITKLECAYFSLILGGIVGNYVDRIMLSGVIDYIGIILGSYYFPIFNFADICIVLGVILILIDGWIGDRSGIRSKKR